MNAKRLVRKVLNQVGGGYSFIKAIEVVTRRKKLNRVEFRDLVVAVFHRARRHKMLTKRQVNVILDRMAA